MRNVRQWGVFLGLAVVLAVGAACETSAGSTTTADVPATQEDVADEETGGGGGGGEAGDCEGFCADMVAACPEDDTMESCLHSCEGVGTDPSADAMACAAAADDCAATRTCWGQLGW